MILIENVEVFGWEAAIRGMRNPMNSWDKSDSVFGDATFYIGEADLKLMRNLAKAGNDHGKFARTINVTVDITAPLYWWKEFDTYKVGTVANSCSTMHRLTHKPFEMDDFSCEHLTDIFALDNASNPLNAMEHIIFCLNFYRNIYLKEKDKRYWWQMIQLLPTSYNQKRTVQLNYQVLWSMYQARKNHKLDCWRDFCKWVETLPYFKEIYLEV